MTDAEKQAELIELKDLTAELVNTARTAIASGCETLPRMTRALALASITLYVAHHGEAATAKFFRELADEIDCHAPQLN